MKLLSILLCALCALVMLPASALAKDTQRAAGWNSRTTHQPADTWSYFQPAVIWCAPAGLAVSQEAAVSLNAHSLGCDSQVVPGHCDLARVVHYLDATAPAWDTYAAYSATDPAQFVNWNTCDDLANGRLAKDATQPTWLSVVHLECTA